MYVKETISKRKVKGPFSITAALTSAVFEWILMVFLFVDGGFAYLVTKFARYCQLQVPCLLCSRLDHVLGKERAGFYWDLICPNHKLKISSLVLCHLHNNLVDVHGMCESCLFSFATANKSNAETYRLLVGKLGAEPHLEEQFKGQSGIRKCYCCNKECVSRGYAQKLLHIASLGSNAVVVDATLPETSGPERGDPKKIENDPSVSICDPLPHLEYKRVKVSSDSESEGAHSDCDSARSLIRERDCSKNDSYDRSLHPKPQTFTVTDDFVTEKLIRSASVPEPSLVDSELDFKSRDLPSITPSAAASALGLEEINRHQAERKTDASDPFELVTFDEVSPLPNISENHADVAIETLNKAGNEFKGSGKVSGARSDAIPNSGTELDSKPLSDEHSLQTTGSFDLGDAYKLAVGSRGRQLPRKFLEQLSFKESTRISEDLKLLLTQLSASRGTDILLSENSPRVSGNGDVSRTSEASSSVGMQILQKRISLERNESGLSLEGSAVSEIEGESVADRLKRQVDHDRKLLAALYREFEEERNASAIAASQAMAIITRLQEEKAALQMEALQWVRMMEEQAEYDNEALLNANDLLAQKEKEIQDLEAELVLYKKKLGNMAVFEDTLEASYDSNRGKQADTISSEGSSSVACNLNAVKTNINIENEAVTSCSGANIDKRSPLLDFESERQQIMQCLHKLEERIRLFPKAANQDSAKVNCEFSTEEWVEVSNPKEVDHRECSRYNDAKEDNVHLEPISQTRSHSGELGSPYKFLETLQKAWDQSESRQCTDGGVELETLKNELSVLSSRLKALETEHSFLEHFMNSLRNGDEGHRFIEEIAGHLPQLHFVWDKTRSELGPK